MQFADEYYEKAIDHGAGVGDREPPPLSKAFSFQQDREISATDKRVVFCWPAFALLRGYTFCMSLGFAADIFLRFFVDKIFKSQFPRRF